MVQQSFKILILLKIDHKILLKLRSRDQAGLTLLYENYLSALNGIAFNILKSKAHSEDAIQRAFLKIWDNINQYDENKSTLFTWMAQITRNTALDIKRLKSFEKEHKSESLDPTVHNNKTTQINTDKIDVKSLIDGMDEKYAFVLDHLYLQGYSQSELSKEHGIPLGTIKTRVKKGIEILRDKLKDEKKFILGFITLILLIIIIF